MWRAIKAVSQLIVVSFAFWGALAGRLDPTLAFAGMLVAYIGAEGAETIIAALGEASFDVSYPDDDEDERDTQTDGGRVVYTRTDEGADK